MKICINACWGGFSLSEQAERLYLERSGQEFRSWKTSREDPVLIGVVEELGSKAYGSSSRLEIVEIPDGYEYEIADYDGCETVYAAPYGSLIVV